MKKKTIIILSAVAGVVILVPAIILLSALHAARHYSDGVDMSYFTRYASGDRPVYFVHGPASSVTLGGKTISFDESGRLTETGELERIYDDKGRFDGFVIEGSEGKVSLSYDSSNLLMEKIEDFDFSQGSYFYSYDQNGNLIQETVSLSEGDSLSLGLTRRYIILSKDAYNNWTLRRTPDGTLETRTIHYEADPEGEKALKPDLNSMAYSFVRKQKSPRIAAALGGRFYALASTFEEGADENLNKSLPLLEMAADAGEPEALYLLARCYESGLGKEKDTERAAQLYEEAAGAGSVPAAVLMADRFFDAKDYERALPMLEKAAEAGDAQSSLRLGDMYRNGWGVTKDQASALLSYKTASSDGSLLAMNRLGTCYENGRGCEVDSLSAFRAYQNAAFFGQMNAQYNLAECYRKGIGVPVDRFQARKWYTNAAASGSASAKQALAEMEQEDIDLENIDNPQQPEGEEAPAVDYKEYFNF